MHSRPAVSLSDAMKVCSQLAGLRLRRRKLLQPLETILNQLCVTLRLCKVLCGLCDLLLQGLYPCACDASRLWQGGLSIEAQANADVYSAGVRDVGLHVHPASYVL